MPLRFLLAALLLFSCFSVSAADGVLRIKSQHSVDQTVEKLLNILNEKGMKIMAQVPHSKAANSVGINLKPTTLIIFGNPKVGSPLMQCAPSVAIDLPQKALVQENEKGEVWISYNDPAYLQRRHQIEGCEKNLQKISSALKNLLSAAAN